jgi:hypothetical protein
MIKQRKRSRRNKRGGHVPVKDNRKSNRFTPVQNTWYITSDRREEVERVE